MKKQYFIFLTILFLIPVITHAETRKLYDIFKEEKESRSGLVLEYSGEHKDSFTETGTEKIYYWHLQDVDESASTILNKWNVIFGGYCWQAYRTTDTGGVKLLYNGDSTLYEKVPLNQSDYTVITNTGNFIWDSNDSTWNTTITDESSKEISFTIPPGNGYKMIVSTNSNESLDGYFNFHKDTITYKTLRKLPEAPSTAYYYYGTLTNSNVIKFSYKVTSSIENPTNIKIKMVKNGEIIGVGCDKEGVDTKIGTTQFNSNYNSPAYVGYMYNPNTLVSSEHNAAISGSKYGMGVTYSGGTYTLTNMSTTYNDTHHYTCNNTTGSCSTVRYYYYNDNYVVLSNGKKIEEALEEMLSADDVNQTDSTIKTAIDTWYQNNMTSYTSKLEDTIFCNDRSISNLGGWNPNGGDKATYLQFKNYNENNDLSCTNITDQFSMNNNKAQLIYPVGIITSNEIDLASDFDYYTDLLGMFSGWTLSPMYYDVIAGVFFGDVDTDDSISPVISLKPNTKIIKGDGSKLNPYIVKDYDGGDIEIGENDNSFIEIPDLEHILEGEEVIFHMIPADGLIRIEIIDEDGNIIDYEPTGNENEYKFIMPNSNVTIKPVFQEKLPDIVNPQTGTRLFFALIVVMLLEIGTYYLIQIKKKRMKEFE